MCELSSISGRFDLVMTSTSESIPVLTGPFLVKPLIAVFDNCGHNRTDQSEYTVKVSIALAGRANQH